MKYALYQAWQNRQRIKEYQLDPLLQSKSVLEIDPQQLKSKGILALAIDYDGVLASYGETTLNTEVDKWLKSCVSIFEKERVFILTNKPTALRLSYFAQYFSGITIVRSKQKKPYPDGILEILQSTKLSGEQLLVIDDRLLTGILAAIIANSKALYITRPFISFSNRPIQELFFIILRLVERLLF